MELENTCSEFGENCLLQRFHCSGCVQTRHQRCALGCDWVQVQKLDSFLWALGLTRKVLPGNSGLAGWRAVLQGFHAVSAQTQLQFTLLCCSVEGHWLRVGRALEQSEKIKEA